MITSCWGIARDSTTLLLKKKENRNMPVSALTFQLQDDGALLFSSQWILWLKILNI